MLAFDEYNKAKKQAEKQYRFALVSGKYPYLPALDDILASVEITAEVPLGLVEIPLDLIVGTKTAGRQTAMANNFMPLLEDKTEFAGKWMTLLASQEKEGIREPIQAFEYMNKFYVQEGNKRVSVLKYMGAGSIPGYVTRIVPKRSDELENKLYYEFIDFYRVSQINDITFSHEGSYKKLIEVLNTDPEQPWDEDFRLNVRSLFLRFSKAFKEKGGEKLSITTGDAFLIYLQIFDTEHMSELSDRQLSGEIGKIWEEFQLSAQGNVVALVEQPEKAQSSNLWSRIIPPTGAQKKYKIAFIYEKNAETSSWTYGHELGRLHLEEVFGEQVTTLHFDEIDSEESAVSAIDLAIAAGCNIIFTTTPTMITASLKSAITHPEVKILNCSVNTSYKSIRTYYGRMYEAKFLIGALAAAVSQSDDIGYIADYPIYGMMANINAFALGAQMINPNIKIHLDWSTLRDHDCRQAFAEKGITCISGQDAITPVNSSRQFGLYKQDTDSIFRLATPIWNWGKYYELILRSVMEGSWNNTEKSIVGEQALNYWWGMSAEVIDLIYSQHIPAGTKRLIELLKYSVQSGEFPPFAGILRSQNGPITTKVTDSLTPEQIVTMNWLAENVIGKIPELEELNDEAQQVVKIHGITTSETAAQGKDTEEITTEV